MFDKSKAIVSDISRDVALGFLLPKHYSGRKPQITKAFGWFFGEELKAVCTFGKPASYTLCSGSFGKSNSHSVYELNRLCRENDLNLQLSQFVGACLREVKDRNWIIFSYSDMGMNHHGYIYQSCNFYYTGATKRRLEFYVEGGHSRHGSKESNKRQVRTSKHRYFFLATNSKKQKKKWMSELNYEIKPYPKGENKEYTLGDVYKPEVVEYTKRNGNND